MNEFDQNDYPARDYAEPICTRCFSDEGIAGFIESFGGSPGCSFCGCEDAPTAPFEEVADHIRECLMEFYGLAAEQLPYETREGGYQAPHWDTDELLFDQIGLDLPRDSNNRLFFTLPNRVSDQTWCEYDWLLLDYDRALDHAWKDFCQTTQHERRFFFALPKGEEAKEEGWYSHPDDYPPLRLLSEIVALAEELDLIRSLASGTEFFRSRPCSPTTPYQMARELGPPPPEKATQANRMNPPGIPMMYGAETEDIAAREARCPCVTVGRFRLERETRILDLIDLPTVPGIFSGVTRRERLGLIFMHAFAREIARPIDRTDRIHIEYIPSQVVTEFIRGTEISNTPIDGIRYPSTLSANGSNLVLFAMQEDLVDFDGKPVSKQDYSALMPWIRLIESRLVEIPDSK